LATYISCPTRTRTYLAFCVLPLTLSACGGGSGYFATRPISVYLPVSSVQITAGAKAVSIPIQIASTS